MIPKIKIHLFSDRFGIDNPSSYNQRNKQNSVLVTKTGQNFLDYMYTTLANYTFNGKILRNLSKDHTGVWVHQVFASKGANPFSLEFKMEKKTRMVV